MNISNDEIQSHAEKLNLVKNQVTLQEAESKRLRGLIRDNEANIANQVKEIEAKRKELELVEDALVKAAVNLENLEDKIRNANTTLATVKVNTELATKGQDEREARITDAEKEIEAEREALKTDRDTLTIEQRNFDTTKTLFEKWIEEVKAVINKI